MLPPVYSTTVSSGAISPSRSAPSIIASAIRSLRDPVGFRYSSFSQSSAPFAGAQRQSRTRGVLPIASRMDSTRASSSTVVEANVDVVLDLNRVCAARFVDVAAEDEVGLCVLDEGADGGAADVLAAS